MLRKFFVLTLAVVTAAALSIPTFAQSNSDITKVRSKVQELSLNRDQTIEIKLKDSTKFKGNISNVSPDSFSVTEAKSAKTTTFNYGEVAQVKKSGGGGLSTKTWLILGGVAAGVVTTFLIVKPAVCDGGAQSRGIC